MATQPKVVLSSSYEGAGLYVLHVDGKPTLVIETNSEDGPLATWLLALPDAPPTPTEGLPHVVDKADLAPACTNCGGLDKQPASQCQGLAKDDVGPCPCECHDDVWPCDCEDYKQATGQHVIHAYDPSKGCQADGPDTRAEDDLGDNWQIGYPHKYT